MEQLPRIGLGMYRMKVEEVDAAVDPALAAGYRLFDTGAVYRNEEALGAALRKYLPKYGLSRNDIFVTSKLAPADHGYEECKAAVMKSLKNLGLDWIDLYLVHWPGKAKLAPESKEHALFRRDSWRALEELKDQGILRNIGVSNYTESHLREMREYARVFPLVNQIELHPLYRPDDTFFDLCKEMDIHVQAYSSLTQGKMLTPQFAERHPRFKEMISEQRTAAQILLSWALQHGWSVIPKASHPDRIRSNFQTFKLTDDEMAYLDSLVHSQEAGKLCWDPSVVL